MVKKPHKLLGGSDLYTEIERKNPGLLGEKREGSVPKRTRSISESSRESAVNQRDRKTLCLDYTATELVNLRMPL